MLKLSSPIASKAARSTLMLPMIGRALAARTAMVGATFRQMSHPRMMRLGTIAAATDEMQGQSQNGGKTYYGPASINTVEKISYNLANRTAGFITVSGQLESNLETVETPQGIIGRLPLNVYISKDSTQRFTIEVYDGLGPVASEKLFKGMRISVVGRLRLDNFVDNGGVNRIEMVVEADEITMCSDSKAPVEVAAEQGPPSVRSPPPSPRQEVGSGGGARAPFVKITPEREAELWNLLRKDKNKFYDNSLNGPYPKRNPKGPDFKLKETGEALWISSFQAPAWVRELA